MPMATVFWRDFYLKFVRPATAEFIGTCLFVFLVVCSATSCDYRNAEQTPLVVGLIITGLVIALMDVSGAHLNPVVTLAIYMAGEIKLHLSLLYVFAQLSGSILGAAFAKVVLQDNVWKSIKGGSNSLGKGVSVGVGIFTEILITTNLLIIILVSAVDSNTKSHLTSIAIGIAVGTGIYATGSVTGGSMNPARSFGPAVVGSYWENHYVYWIGPIIGCLLSSFLYHFVLASPEKIILFKRKNKQEQCHLAGEDKGTEMNVQMLSEEQET